MASFVPFHFNETSFFSQMSEAVPDLDCRGLCGLRVYRGERPVSCVSQIQWIRSGRLRHDNPGLF